jgi:two-component system, NtrC family, sensor kinase
MNRIKSCITILLILLEISGIAQDRVLEISASKRGQKQQIQLADQEGWVFKGGSNTAWANPDLDDSGWKSMKPTELSTKFADENGRVEGWFRINIQLDSSFSGIPVRISRQLWAATDIYLDGKLVTSFGNTGHPYKAYNPVLKYSRPLSIVPGKKHVLAIHFVDYETLFTQRELRLKPQNLKNFLSICGPDFDKAVTKKIRETYIIGSGTISVAIILFLLFVLLLALNAADKIFQMAVILTCTVLLGAFGSFLGYFQELPYAAEKAIFIFTSGFSLPVMHALTLLITEWVLTKRTSAITKIILITMPLTSLLGHVFNISWPFGLVEVVLLGYFFRLVYTSRQRIKNIEWTVILAMGVLTFGSLIWVFLHKYYFDSFYDIENFLKAIVLLSAPTLFLLYVAFSYKEILAEKEAEALNVIRITEEKKELLERQNVLLEEQVAERTRELEKSLADLKSTQAQLIQSEKMASLGELTAGIAHEIQNPLNFVNNFSEVSVDLANELKDEIKKTEKDWGLIEDLATDLSQNQEKINHHGKRASDIVKGMLEHSRKSSGEKEATDINALCDEYLRLAYHGLKAKDNNFNATMETHFDPNLPKIPVIPQDIGRVILNLINNAFYAVNERNKKGEAGYQPTVSITTQLTANTQLLIAIKDNGSGIPAHIKDKIFQPFFTTKPTGQGTGLGLSLSYDIVKAKGGEIKLNTQENEGTTFTIEIPV